jgi:hypothetical protein
VDRRKNVESYLKDFRAALERDIDLERVILFGSRARHEANEHSDVDLIVVSSNFEGMDFFDRVAKMYDYWNSDLPVDFLCYTPEEFERLKDQATIVRQAVRTGVDA